MKPTISLSLAPRSIRSRMLLRRSTARSACESASVWFWHTRQRSSEASAMTRFSKTGSSLPTTHTEKNNRKRNANALFTRQLAHQRRYLLRRDFLRHGADALVTDHALLVDDVGFRNAIDAIVDADASGAVEHRQDERVAVAREPGQRVLARVLVVEAHHRRGQRLREGGDYRKLLQGRLAPRRPDVEEPHLAEHLPRGEGLSFLLQERQLERRRRLADERRRHFARVEAQARRQYSHQEREHADHGEDPRAHARASTAAPVVFLEKETRYRRSLAASRPPSAMIRQPPQIQSMNGL